MDLELILSIVAIVASVVGVIGASKGAVMTAERLKRTNRFDAVVMLFAWIDRTILRSKPSAEIEPSGPSALCVIACSISYRTTWVSEVVGLADELGLRSVRTRWASTPDAHAV